MKSILRWLARGGVVLAAAAGPIGCDDGGGSDLDYGGAWQGRTSHGGTVGFTVDGSSVTSFRIVDDQANVQITQPVDIHGDSFSAENSAGVSSPGSPAVSLQATFDSDTHCAGRYSIANAWSGTFEATRP